MRKYQNGSDSVQQKPSEFVSGMWGGYGREEVARDEGDMGLVVDTGEVGWDGWSEWPSCNKGC